jgi:hypothetical protein
MERQRERPGPLVASLGGAGLIASLWLPWYSFRFPAAAINTAVQIEHQFGVPASLRGLVHPAWGIYLALGSAILMTVGGAFAGSERAPGPAEFALDLSAPAPGAATWSTARSVPPPTH